MTSKSGQRLNEKFLTVCVALALGILIGIALATRAIADYEIEYTVKYEEPIKITSEVYEQYEATKLAESIKSKPKTTSGGFRTFPRVTGKNLCSCVETAKILANKEFSSIGYARNLKGNTDSPEVGDIVILDESPSGHLAVIKTIWADTYVIMEGNYERCAYTEREISKTYNKILGFYN